MDELKVKRNGVKEAMRGIGGQTLLAHIDEQIREGWERFIELPPEKKTSKAAYAATGKYKALKELKDWIETEVKMAD